MFGVLGDFQSTLQILNLMTGVHHVDALSIPRFGLGQVKWDLTRNTGTGGPAPTSDRVVFGTGTAHR